MNRKLALIHTVTSLAPTFNELAGELLEGIDVFHIADETLLDVTREEGQVTPTTRRRLLSYAVSAQEAGADMVMVTCSSIGPAVDSSHDFMDVPLLRVDEAMADRAVATGDRVGVLATLRSTLEPTAKLVERRGQASGRDVAVTARVCDGAFEAVISGDTETHDRLVRKELLEVISKVDVVVLAQASMARVAEQLTEEERSVPVLSSPRLGMERVAEVFEGLSG